MKFIHLSDLHLGKRVNEVSMIEDQKYILIKLRQIIKDEKPDGVIMAGDIYDRATPSAEAVQLFDEFLTWLADEQVNTFIISGNHDSAERIAFASNILNKAHIYISPVYDGTFTPITLKDTYGEVKIYLLPFIKPIHVRQVLAEEERESIVSYDDAMKKAVEQMSVDAATRNLLVTHQFVTGAEPSESEDSIQVGGTDNVSGTIFKDFDYVALGHIHKPQKCGRDTIRYCGTPLKYSFSEVKDTKSVTVVELKEKNEVEIRTIDLIPLHDWVELKGKYDELMAKPFYEGTSWPTDYVRAILTDEDEIPEAMAKLRTVYKNIMKMEYDNTRTRENRVIEGAEDVEKKDPIELFGELFMLQNNVEMNEKQTDYLKALIDKIGIDKFRR